MKIINEVGGNIDPTQAIQPGMMFKTPKNDIYYVVVRVDPGKLMLIEMSSMNRRNEDNYSGRTVDDVENEYNLIYMHVNALVFK